jgi:pimeloyl-ACP methyl ester carboxylesterase
MADNPTVVLVHGAFADASSFAKVIPELFAAGISVVAATMPMRSLTGDAAYIASLIEQINGPVLLVGHSYGCAVTTIAGVVPNVVGLVYLSGYALQEGESLGELQGGFPDSDLAQALVQNTFPVPGSEEPGIEATIDVAKFPAVVAADVNPELARILAVSQRPLGIAAFGEAAPSAAWKTTPSWGIVSKADHTINPDVQRFGYTRAGMPVIEVESSHMVILSHPREVVELITHAIASITGSAPG